MNLESILQQVLNFTGTFNFNLIIFLFLICSIGEFSFSVPYLLETVWMMSGYNLGTGAFSPLHIVLLWLVAQAARQTGATALYHLSRFGSIPIMKLYQKYFESSVSKKISDNNSLPFKFIRKINYLSPFSVALGRLFWLRIPLTMTLGVQRKPKVLSGGVLISSLIWDGVYITIGVVIGITATPKPMQMILYSLIGLTVLYVITFAAKQLPKLLRRQAPKDA